MRFRFDPVKAAANFRKHGELLVVVWTQTADECRLISARPPTRKERKHYES